MQMNIGKVLKAIRKSKQLNQHQVANHLLVSRPTYLRYEHNLTEIPFTKLVLLAELYDFEPIDFMRFIMQLPQGEKSARFSGRDAFQNHLTNSSLKRHA